MNNKVGQQGLGLVEVLVAVLLLAIAVLGFSTLQMQAVKSTDESLKRTQAMSVIRGLSESMRSNTSQIDKYQEVVNDASEAGTITVESCKNLTDPCAPEDIAAKEALKALKDAEQYDLKLGVATCPSTNTNAFSELKCIIAAWNDTTAAFGTESTDCAAEDGTYNIKTDCLIIEAY